MNLSSNSTNNSFFFFHNHIFYTKQNTIEIITCAKTKIAASTRASTSSARSTTTRFRTTATTATATSASRAHSAPTGAIRQLGLYTISFHTRAKLITTTHAARIAAGLLQVKILRATTTATARTAAATTTRMIRRHFIGRIGLQLHKILSL